MQAPFYTLDRSAVLNVTSPAGVSYPIMVAWPDTPPPAKGWPILYVLDGEDNFAVAALTARRLARAGERSGIDPGIVVAIGAGPLPRRVRDYTPPVAGYHIPAGRPAAGLETGGGGAFLDMLAEQVMPLIRQHWSVDPARESIMGHSFGGLIAVHALLTRPRMFDRVVAISPSFWFGDGLLLREAASHPPQYGTHLLIASGSEERGAQEAAAAFAAKLQSTSGAPQVRFLALPGQTHGTTFLAALGAAIGEAFGRTAP